MRSKILGGTLLIIGTSIGAGMLGLPVATAAGGYFHSLILFFAAWLVMTFGALLILEVNLWLPENTNLISMARITLGRWGQLLTWISYLMLLYSLLAAYTSGGSDLLQSLLLLIHINTPGWLSSVLFVLVLGAVLFHGIRVVDLTNRGLMTVKMSAYVLLIVLVTPRVDLTKLEGGHARLLYSAIFIAITSFGYATIIPSLRSYFKSNVKALRLTILLGSIISLICYLLWDLVVQGVVMAGGSHGLIHMAISGHATSQLTGALSNDLGNPFISDLAHTFTSIAMTTSFLGVSLCLSDFFTDGLSMKRRGMGRGLNILITLGPPLLIVILSPGIFLFGLKLAGLFCVILLMLIPALMAWSGRYVKKVATGYRVRGGALAVALEILISIVLIVVGVLQLS